MFKTTILCLLFTLFAASAPLTLAQSAGDRLQLPSFGDASGGLVSPAMEYELGQKIVRRYRGGLPTSNDPFLEDYLLQLLQRMAFSSELEDKRLELLVLDNPNLNAFAAPGGIIGVNTGTLLIARTEQQLASILAHELAHLSQRHFARRVQQNQNTTLASYAAILAGILVTAASGSDAGLAMIPAIQAGAIDRSLRFSRQMEQEADRVGMETLTRAGFDAQAMPEMFEQMLRLARFRSKVPEFLLTHPITESRIADSSSRAARYPRRTAQEDKDYQLMRARAILHHEASPQLAVRRFTNELTGSNLPRGAARYGLVLALTKAGRLDEADKELETLHAQLDHPVALTIAAADILAARQKLPEALKLLEKQLRLQPRNHPLNIRSAELLMEAGQYDRGQALLQEHVKRHPGNVYAWYLLAEINGLAGRILDVHRARSEYFILNGMYDKAEIQLRNALRLTDKEDIRGNATLEQRLMDVRRMKQDDI